MSTKNCNPWKIYIGAMLACVGCSLALQADAPQGWFLAGSKPSEFEAGVDRLV